MNLPNINKAITIMERVLARGDRLFMENWQKDSNAIFKEEADLHTCGSSACFAGWVGVSPEWKELGGTVSLSGCPELWDEDNQRIAGDDAIAEWLEIPTSDALSLCGLFLDHPNKSSADVTVDDVLNTLYRLRDTGSVYVAGSDGVVYPEEEAP